MSKKNNITQRCILFLCIMILYLIHNPKSYAYEIADNFSYPLSNWVTTCGFGVPCYRDNHLGIDGYSDDRLGDQIPGTPVYAPCNGEVKEAQPHDQYGGTVLIEANTGSEIITILIAHMNAATLVVEPNTDVQHGQLIGYLGTELENGGWDPHCHMGIHKGSYQSYCIECSATPYSCNGNSPSEWVYAGYTYCPNEILANWHDPEVFIASYSSTYLASWADQTPYYPEGLDYYPVMPGQIVHCTFIFNNDGTAYWTGRNDPNSPHYVELRSVNGPSENNPGWNADQWSPLEHNWLDGNGVRIATTRGNVDPFIGQGLYRFDIAVPDAPGDYWLYVALYHPNSGQYISGTGPTLRVNVVCSTPVDAALIIDCSGSMSWNDPTELRERAAHFYVDLAQQGDKVVPVGFSSSSFLFAPLTTINSIIDRNFLKQRINVYASGGTHLGAGILTAYNQLLAVEGDGNRKAGILLTDGLPSYGPPYYYDRFANKGWPIYTIGLGNFNTSLLQQIAEATGGEFFPAPSNSALQQVYQQIAGELQCQGNEASIALQLEEGQQTTEILELLNYYLQLTFSINWGGSKFTLNLIQPDGAIIDSMTTDPNVYYVSGPTYEIFRITDPMSGQWGMIVTGVDVPAGGENVNLNIWSIAAPEPVDNTPPVITITSPVFGKTYFDGYPVRFDFIVEDPESDITSTLAVLNGTTPVENGNELMLTSPGQNQFIVTATNAVGLSNADTVDFTVNYFRWLPPIMYSDSGGTEVIEIQPNSTLPVKFFVRDAQNSFVTDTSVQVFVEGTTAMFTYGQADTCIRIDMEDPEDCKYIVNLHTNFRHWDYGIEEGNEYWIRAYFDNIPAGQTKLIVIQNGSAKSGSAADMPERTELLANYPNPFNLSTQITYSLPQGSHVKIEIYNILGSKIRTLVDEYQAAGWKTITWDSKDNNNQIVSGGIYFYRIKAGEFSDNRKMLLLK